MSNDTFIREVNEEMRQDRVAAIWRRFGPLVIALVVLAVVATIGFVVWDRYRAAEAAADGDRYFAAVELAEAGDTQGAVEALGALADDGVAAYPHLARLRIASTLASSGDRAGAVAALDEVALSAPEPLRDIAAVRAAYLLVDEGTPDDVRQRVERLTNEAEALRHPAREALGLSLWRAGDGEAARGFFQQITEDLSAPSGISQRAGLMLELIATGSVLPAPGTPAAEPVPDAPVADTPTSAEGAPAASPEAAAPAPAAADPTLTTPLAEQLDLPPAQETPSDEAAPAAADPSTAAPSQAPTDEPVPGASPPS